MLRWPPGQAGRWSPARVNGPRRAGWQRRLNEAAWHWLPACRKAPCTSRLALPRKGTFWPFTAPIIQILTRSARLLASSLCSRPVGGRFGCCPRSALSILPKYLCRSAVVRLCPIVTRPALSLSGAGSYRLLREARVAAACAVAETRNVSSWPAVRLPFSHSRSMLAPSFS